MNASRNGGMSIQGIVTMAIVVIALIALLVVYNKHAEKERRAAEQSKIERARAEDEARKRKLKEEEEMEKKLREVRLAREKESAEREAVERERKRKKAEAEAERQKQIEIADKRREVYRVAQGHFRGMIRMEEHVPVNERLQGARASGKFWCVFASYAIDKLIYEINVANGVIMKAVALSLENEQNEIDISVFKQKFNKEACAYATDNKLVLRCVQAASPYYSVPKRGKDFYVAEERLGELYSILTGLGVMFDDILCRVTLRSNSSKISHPLGVIGFGDSLPRDKIEEVIRKLVVKNNETGNMKPINQKKPRFKRTVVLYDGTSVTRQLNGVTKVPRDFKFSGTTRTAIKKWHELYNEAIRQERDEKRFYAQYEAKIAEEKRNASMKQVRAANLANDKEVIDQALARYKLFVEFGKRKNTSLSH